MREVDGIYNFKFDSAVYRKYSEEYASCKIKKVTQLLDKEVENLQARLNELLELKDFIAQGSPIYLFKNNESEYGYLDSEGNNYEYKKINEKPVLIDEYFNLYEIVGYSVLDDIWQDRGNSIAIKTWVDKVVKVESIQIQKNK